MIAPVLLNRILEQLAVVRTQCPELRFAQLLAIVGELAADETGHSLWDVEDADFAAALERFAMDISHRDSQSNSIVKPSGAEREPSPAPSQPREQVS
jgi:hypothetical protein